MRRGHAAAARRGRRRAGGAGRGGVADVGVRRAGPAVAVRRGRGVLAGRGRRGRGRELRGGDARARGRYGVLPGGDGVRVEDLRGHQEALLVRRRLERA